MSDAADHSRKRLPVGALLALGLLVLATAFFRPGDAPFINDEPLLIHMARAANHIPGRQYGIPLPFSLCAMSMAKTPRGLYYGPAATWLYQALVAVTYDPILLVSLHALLLAAVTAAALGWLARTMGVSVWLAVVVMLSPWLWIYHRMVWDNNLCIALSAMAVAAYGDYLASRRGWPLRLSVFCLAVLPLVHLMTLALVVPMTAHLILFQWRGVWKYKWTLLAIVLIINALAWQYWQYLMVFYQSVGAPGFSPWRGWVFPFFGGQDLSAWPVDDLLGEGWYVRFGGVFPYVVAGAEVISCLAYVAVWIGMLLAAGRTLKILGRRKEMTAADHLAAIALGILICQCVLDGWQRAYGLPHYFNGTWIAFVVFAWLTVEMLYRRYWATSILVRLAVPVQAAMLAIVLWAMVFKIAVDGGTRSLGYGTVLSEQVTATQEIGKFADSSEREILFRQWQMFPDAPATLEELIVPVAASPDSRPLRRVIVRYRDAYPQDARIVVENRPL